MNRQAKTLLVAAVAIGWLVFSGIKEASVYFKYPSELTPTVLAELGHEELRIGGMVAGGSLEREGSDIRFVMVDDGEGQVLVHYVGIPPDMFAEGRGAVVEGSFTMEGVFEAHTLMVKHGEDYSAEEHPDRENIRSDFGTGIPDPGG
ncbi:cytochrome c maturation protein CcmE [bacterium]|nr:cytochrome c maturation protein CcmE [bacterium]